MRVLYRFNHGHVISIRKHRIVCFRNYEATKTTKCTEWKVGPTGLRYTFYLHAAHSTRMWTVSLSAHFLRVWRPANIEVMKHNFKAGRKQMREVREQRSRKTSLKSLRPSPPLSLPPPPSLHAVDDQRLE